MLRVGDLPLEAVTPPPFDFIESSPEFLYPRAVRIFKRWLARGSCLSLRRPECEEAMVVSYLKRPEHLFLRCGAVIEEEHQFLSEARDL